MRLRISYSQGEERIRPGKYETRVSGDCCNGFLLYSFSILQTILLNTCRLLQLQKKEAVLILRSLN